MANKLLIELRLVQATVVCTAVGSILLLICIVCEDWVTLVLPGGQYRNETGTFIMEHHSGLWKICRMELDNRTSPIVRHHYCNTLTFDEEDEHLDPEVNPQILNYNRSEIAFAVIALFLSVLANLFAVYSIQQVRYMFKRLAAMLYLITVICLLVMLEVFQHSVNDRFFPSRPPANAETEWGWCFAVSWVVFIIYVAAPIIMLISSRKRKGDKARTDDEARENEPVILGRVG